MSNQLFPVLNGSGGEVLPTANGTFYTASVSTNTSPNCQVYIEFFSDASGLTPVTPTGGTVTLAASPMGNNYLPASNGAVVQAIAVSTPDSTYTPPVFNGRIAFGKATFAGITGAAYARVTFWRYG